MEIWLVRHGETDWNAEGRVQGWTDVPLNAKGRQQASQLAQCLRSISFAHIYASDLTRALDTARIVADAVGAPITPLACLREHRFGQAEGLLRQESDRRFPNGAPDREPPEALQARVTQCLQDIAKRHAEGRVLIATHGGVIRSILNWLGHSHPPIANTSITRLRARANGFDILGVNETPHLDGGSAMELISQHR